MFVGHYAPALLGKAIEPRAPLWVLLLAVQAVDVAWAVLVLLGVERVRLDPALPSNPLVLEHMPYTHGLVATAAWTGGAYLAARAFLERHAAAVVAAAVASHWVADLLVHRPDLPVVAGPPRLGLGLWDFPWIALPLELALLLGTAWWCVRNEAVARPRRVLAFAVVLAVVQVAMALGPAPSDVARTVTAALAFFLVVAAAGLWVDPPRRSASRGP